MVESSYMGSGRKLQFAEIFRKKLFEYWLEGQTWWNLREACCLLLDPLELWDYARINVDFIYLQYADVECSLPQTHKLMRYFLDSIRSGDLECKEEFGGYYIKGSDFVQEAISGGFQKRMPARMLDAAKNTGIEKERDGESLEPSNAKKKRGRRPTRDRKRDKKIHDQWVIWDGYVALGERKTVRLFAELHSYTAKDVRAAVDNHKKKVSRKD